MSAKLVACVAASAVFLAGCGKPSGSMFETIVASNGATIYRMNKSTGQMFAVNGGGMVPVKEIDLSEKIPAEGITSWSESLIFNIGDRKQEVRAYLNHRWINGTMRYTLTVSPVDAFTNYWPDLKVGLCDDIGFELEKLPTVGRDTILLPDGHQAFKFESSMRMPKDHYVEIAKMSFTMSWSASPVTPPPLSDAEWLMKNFGKTNKY